MCLLEMIKSKRREIIEIAARHGARNVRLFGSVVRGEDDDKSDIDFLMEMSQNTSLMDHASLLNDLEKLLGRSVDVAPDDCLRPRIRERILNESIAL